MVRKRYNVRPGLICVWWIRKRANIAYEHEGEADTRYAETQTLWRGLSIALRAIPSVLYGEGLNTAPDGITVLGIPVANMTMTDALEAIFAHLNHAGTHQVCFVNPHCANIAWRHIAYRRVLCHATLTLADGIRMKLAGKFLGQGFKQNVNGTDLFPRLARDYPVPIEKFSSLEANRARWKAYVTGSQSIIQQFSPVDTVTATSRLSRTQTSSATSVPLNGCARWVLNGCTDCIRSPDVCGGGTCLATLFSCTGC